MTGEATALLDTSETSEIVTEIAPRTGDDLKLRFNPNLSENFIIWYKR